MTGNTPYKTDNIIPWGWRHLGQNAARMQVHMGKVIAAKAKITTISAANADYAPLGLDPAVTCNRGLALLSKIAGA